MKSKVKEAKEINCRTEDDQVQVKK